MSTDHVPPIESHHSPDARHRRWPLGVGAFTGAAAVALLVPVIASGDARSTVGSDQAEAAVARPFVAVLSGVNEVPPADADGSGSAAVTIDVATGEVCADLRVADIQPAVMAHIHRGAAGAIGPVVVPLNAPNPTSATCTTVDPALATEIATTPAGFYVNVHTGDYPNGAVRGQLAASTAVTGDVQLLAEPLRAYDSRVGSAGPIAAGSTRTISLAMGMNGQGQSQLAVPPGATAAMVRLTITDAVGAGWLKLYSAALTSEPATASANWYEPNSIVGSEATVVVDPLGRVKVTAGVNSTHFVIDVVGYVF